MADTSPDKIVIGTLGPLITAVIGAAIAWLSGGADVTGRPLMVLLTAVGGISGLAFSLMYKRYIGVLGAGGGRKGYPARDAYESLRASLSGGNLASRLYAEWLTRFLDAVDCFLGDAGMADRTLFPQAFGLKTPAPLWTAPAFDRCLLLALIYPIATISIIWAVSGHVGPAEAALGLKSDLAGWRRALAAGLIGLSSVSIGRGMLTSGFKSAVWAVSGSFVIAAAAVAGASAALIGCALGGGIALVRMTGTITAPLAVAAGIACAAAITGADEPSLVGPLGAFMVAGVWAITSAVLHEIATRKRRQGAALSLLVLAMITMCFGAAVWLPHYKVWSEVGPILLVVGLLTLFNAPFDWASLGLTRALLRRGLELGGWWPYFLALVDALAAAFIIALLAITMVVGVQTFDHLAEHVGGVDARILPLDKLFDGMVAQPSAPEYWWAYALLLSTMIPSLLNLMIGGASLLRGIPGFPALLLRFMPAGKAVPAFERAWLALVLTFQVFLGAFLGIAAQFVLAIGVIFYVLPWMGLELLDTARAVAEFDLPGKVLGLWWGKPL